MPLLTRRWPRFGATEAFLPCTLAPAKACLTLVAACSRVGRRGVRGGHLRAPSQRGAHQSQPLTSILKCARFREGWRRSRRQFYAGSPGEAACTARRLAGLLDSCVLTTEQDVTGIVAAGAAGRAAAAAIGAAGSKPRPPPPGGQAAGPLASSARCCAEQHGCSTWEGEPAMHWQQH